jgi:hypothetical protein
MRRPESFPRWFPLAPGRCSGVCAGVTRCGSQADACRWPTVPRGTSGRSAIQSVAISRCACSRGSLRNERLAHQQTNVAAVAEADATAGEIESFYHDMSELIRLLAHLVCPLPTTQRIPAAYSAIMLDPFGLVCARSGLKVIRTNGDLA